MNDMKKVQPPVDLDELERELRLAGHEPDVHSESPASYTPRPALRNDDPLAELARIVGDKDPFGDIFAARRTPPPVSQSDTDWTSPASRDDRASPSTSPADWPLDDIERSISAALAGGGAGVALATSLGSQATRSQQPNPRADVVPAPAPPAARSRIEPPSYESSSYAQSPDQDADAWPEPQRLGVEPVPPMPPPSGRFRVGRIAMLGVVGAAVIGIGGLYALRGDRGPARTGEPPVIRADTGPARVQPPASAAPDVGGAPTGRAGVDVAGAAGPSRVVTREEQPVDAAQAVRSAAPRVILPNPGSAPPPQSGVIPVPGAASSGATSPAVPPAANGGGDVASLLGEPRRVRTVTVRPDGAVAPATVGAASPPPPARPVDVAAAVPPAAASAPAAPAVPRVQTPAPRPVASTPRPAPRAPAGEAEATDAPLAITPPRTTAATRPQTTAAAPTASPSVAAPAATASAVAAPASANGSFIVQIASNPSETDARTTFTQLQRRFPDALGGKAPNIRRADLGDRGVFYRVRVGPFSKTEADRICDNLKGGGAGCIVQRN